MILAFKKTPLHKELARIQAKAVNAPYNISELKSLVSKLHVDGCIDFPQYASLFMALEGR